MILFRAVLFLSVVAMACSSSEPEQQQPEYPNLIALNPPDTQQVVSSNVYVDSVKVIDHNNEKALLISGNLASGCTYLRDASHTAAADSLQLSLTAWKPADKMCTQALVPFSFIYEELPSAELETHSRATVNDQTFKLKKE